MEMLWEGTNTTAREERRKEGVLAVLRGLVEDSNSKREVREYVPWSRYGDCERPTGKGF